jgi:hypothetical protein
LAAWPTRVGQQRARRKIAHGETALSQGAGGVDHPVVLVLFGGEVVPFA